MKVKIIDVIEQRYWYSDLIGKIYEVDEKIDHKGSVPRYNVIMGGGRMIMVQDAIVIKEHNRNGANA